MQPNSSDRSPFSSKCAKRVSIYWTFPGFSRNRPRAKTSREKDFTLTRHMKTFFAQMIAICFSTLNTSAAVFSTRGFTENWMNTFCSTMDRAFFPHSFLEREVCERVFLLSRTWLGFHSNIVRELHVFAAHTSFLSHKKFESGITWLAIGEWSYKL